MVLKTRDDFDGVVGLESVILKHHSHHRVRVPLDCLRHRVHGCLRIHKLVRVVNDRRIAVLDDVPRPWPHVFLFARLEVGKAWVYRSVSVLVVFKLAFTFIQVPELGLCFVAHQEVLSVELLSIVSLLVCEQEYSFAGH